jgi:hypothetical protein
MDESGIEPSVDRKLEQTGRLSFLLPRPFGIEASPFFLIGQRPAHLTVFLLEREVGQFPINLEERPTTVVDLDLVAVFLHGDE